MRQYLNDMQSDYATGVVDCNRACAGLVAQAVAKSVLNGADYGVAYCNAVFGVKDSKFLDAFGVKLYNVLVSSRRW